MCVQIIQNNTNSANKHLVFSIFMKKQENNGVGDISPLFQRHCQRLWNKDEISSTIIDFVVFLLNVFEIKTKYHAPTPLFSSFFLNIENTRCLFSEFFLFCISWSCLLAVVFVPRSFLKESFESITCTFTHINLCFHLGATLYKVFIDFKFLMQDEYDVQWVFYKCIIS